MSDAVVRCRFRSGSSPSGLSDVGMRNLEREVGRRIPGDSAAEGIEPWSVEVVTVLIRLAPSEDAAFDLHAAPLQSCGGDSECDMRRILPMMADRCIRIVHGRQS